MKAQVVQVALAALRDRFDSAPVSKIIAIARGSDRLLRQISIQLLASKLDITQVQSLCEPTDATDRLDTFKTVDRPKEIARGDAKVGAKLFNERESTTCTSCHASKPGDAGGGGPSLAGAGTRFTIPYLVTPAELRDFLSYLMTLKEDK